MKITSKTTKAELASYAALSLGVQLDETNFNRDELIAEVRKIEKSLGIVSESDSETQQLEEQTQVEGEAVETKKNPRFVHLRIHTPPSMNADEDASEETHCIVGFNGRNYQIEFDVEEGVKVPYGVYDILRNAVQKRYRRVKGKRELEERQEQRYKFNVVKYID